MVLSLVWCLISPTTKQRFLKKLRLSPPSPGSPSLRRWSMKCPATRSHTWRSRASRYTQTNTHRLTFSTEEIRTIHSFVISPCRCVSLEHQTVPRWLDWHLELPIMLSWKLWQTELKRRFWRKSWLLGTLVHLSCFDDFASHKQQLYKVTELLFTLIYTCFGFLSCSSRRNPRCPKQGRVLRHIYTDLPRGGLRVGAHVWDGLQTVVPLPGLGQWSF